MNALPTPDEMYRALIDRDTGLDGVFYAGIRTTGIFCRPGCGARKPNRANVEFFPTASQALHAGYRPCKRCRPLESGATPPAWVTPLLDWVERSPDRRITATDLRARGVDPARAARYFKARYGMTFQGYQRARRMGLALREIRTPRTTRPTSSKPGPGSTFMTNLPREFASSTPATGAISRAAAHAGFASESGFRDAFTRMFGAAPSRVAREPGGPVTLAARWLETPLGPMLAAASDAGLCLLEFVDRRALATQIAVLRRRFNAVVAPGSNPHLDLIADELDRYFAGRLGAFTTVMAVRGTPFQESVWAALRRIPLGQTRSYAQIAREIGRASAVRAVARANGDNRLAILIPCHRVIGSDGSATGYGGGIWRKNWLLEHERDMARRLGIAVPQREPALFSA